MEDLFYIHKFKGEKRDSFCLIMEGEGPTLESLHKIANTSRGGPLFIQCYIL
jgi:hypothetical protein